jgi:hypothetical protein
VPLALLLVRPLLVELLVVPFAAIVMVGLDVLALFGAPLRLVAALGVRLLVVQNPDQ